MRRGQVLKKIIEPDIKYQSALVAKFINYIMKSGRKAIARGIVYGALEESEKKLGKKALEVLDQVIRNAGPEFPYPVKPERKTTLALRWIIEAAQSKKGKPMVEKLSQEMIDAFNNTGIAVKKKMDTHRMADANRAFAHFAW